MCFLSEVTITTTPTILYYFDKIILSVTDPLFHCLGGIIACKTTFCPANFHRLSSSSRPDSCPPPPASFIRSSRPDSYPPPPLSLSSSSRPDSYPPPPASLSSSSRPDSCPPPPASFFSSSRPDSYPSPPASLSLQLITTRLLPTIWHILPMDPATH